VMAGDYNKPALPAHFEETRCRASGRLQDRAGGDWK
jgi:hypothetical protein